MLAMLFTYQHRPQFPPQSQCCEWYSSSTGGCCYGGRHEPHWSAPCVIYAQQAGGEAHLPNMNHFHPASGIFRDNEKYVDKVYVDNKVYVDKDLKSKGCCKSSQIEAEALHITKIVFPIECAAAQSMKDREYAIMLLLLRSPNSQCTIV